MIAPEKCETLSEVRDAIDALDKQIIELLGKRFDYVKMVPKFKINTEESIVAKPRYDLVLKSRMELAEKNGLDPDIIGKVYKDLLDYFINEQKRIINTQ